MKIARYGLWSTVWDAFLSTDSEQYKLIYPEDISFSWIMDQSATIMESCS